jgi:hypothetical protein
MAAPTNFTALQSNSSLRVNSSGDTISGIYSVSGAIDFASVAAFASSVSTISLPGAIPGCAVVVNPGSNWSGIYTKLTVVGNSDTTDVVNLHTWNSSATALNGDAVTFRVTAITF